MGARPFGIARARDGLRLAVDREGTGDAVVFVHGLGFSRERWSGTRNVLTGAGYQVLTFDLRGFGDSEVPTDSYGMEELVADLEVVTAGLDRFHLVGHSLGGMCAQLFALAHPERVRSLTLVSTTSHSGTRGSAYGAALSYLAMRGFDEAMKDEAFRAKVEWAVEFLADPEVRQELNGTLSHELPSGEKLLALIERMTRTPDPARAFAWSCTVGFSTRKRLSEIR
ncbi:MAG: alpha/beta hydrolase, partial [Myxococcota bacterium]|nr:alpha/beta hydrolase [Myxococcota bacterium]